MIPNDLRKSLGAMAGNQLADLIDMAIAGEEVKRISPPGSTDYIDIPDDGGDTGGGGGDGGGDTGGGDGGGTGGGTDPDPDDDYEDMPDDPTGDDPTPDPDDEGVSPNSAQQSPTRKRSPFGSRTSG